VPGKTGGELSSPGRILPHLPLPCRLKSLSGVDVVGVSKEDKMPFPNQQERAFTRTNVERITPGQMGCYGLFKQHEWIYVGKGDIRKRLLDYLNGDNACITSRGPTHWVDLVTNDYDNAEKALILEFAPTFNKKVG
jgi:hypothetical protein